MSLLALPLGSDRVSMWCFSVASSNQCRAAGRGSGSGIEASRHRIGAVTGAARLKPSCELRSCTLIQPRRSLIVHCFGARVKKFSLFRRFFLKAFYNHQPLKTVPRIATLTTKSDTPGGGTCSEELASAAPLADGRALHCLVDLQSVCDGM